MGRVVKHWLKRLEHMGKDDEIVIELEDGSEERFLHADLRAAFLNEMRRFRGETDKIHPLTLAMSRSSDPNRRSSAFAPMTSVSEVGEILPPTEVDRGPLRALDSQPQIGASMGPYQ
jgi:hypothetical protein